MSILFVILVSAFIAAFAGCYPVPLPMLIVDIVSSIKSRKYRYPPGPKPLPIIGNIHQLPQGQLGKWAQQMAQEYGEMFSIKIGGQRWVFCNSDRVIKDLLERRAAVRLGCRRTNDRFTAQGRKCLCWVISCREGGEFC